MQSFRTKKNFTSFITIILNFFKLFKTKYDAIHNNNATKSFLKEVFSVM